MDATLRSRALEVLGAFPQGDTPSVSSPAEFSQSEHLVVWLRREHHEIVEALSAAFLEDGLSKLVTEFLRARAKLSADDGQERQLEFGFMPRIIFEPKSENWKRPEQLSLREFRDYVRWRSRIIKARGAKLKEQREYVSEMRKLYRDAKKRAGSDVSITLSAALALRATRGSR